MKTATANELRSQAVTAFANALVVAVLNRSLHHANARYVLESLEDLVAALQHAQQVGVEMPLQLQCADDRLLHDGEALDGPSLQARGLLRCCRDRDVAVLSFAPGLEVAEANRMLDLLLLPQHTGALARATRETVLAAFGIRNVRVSLRSPADPCDRRTELDSRGRALRRYQDLADCLQQNHARALHDQELGVLATADVVERTVTDFDEPSLLLALATQDDVDRFTVGHSVRVALLALQVARALGGTRDQLVRVGAAALLHDIGKSKVPQEVLFKQGRLSLDEWRQMQQHPRLGAQILLEQHETVDPRTIGAAFCHHLSPDGEGYPDALLPVMPGGTSRLVRVCDVFEALTSIRPYKRALTPIEAFAVMFRNERDFDTQWLRAFTRTLGLFPNGTRVRLHDGSTAVVREQSACFARPVVQLLTGPNEQALEAGQPDRFVVGDLVEGKPLRILGVDTHDRSITVPELDPSVPPPTAHACLSESIARDAAPKP